MFKIPFALFFFMGIKELAPSYFCRKSFVLHNLGRGKRALNAGCGDGDYDALLKPRFESVFALDVNKADLLLAKARNPNVHYVLGSAEALPFKPACFDEVVCIEVLEHLDRDETALKEIARVLRRGKCLLFSVPNKQYPASFDPINFVLQRFGKPLPFGLWGFGHKRLFTASELKKKLLRNGFSLQMLEGKLHFFAGIFENYYLLNLLQPFTKTSPSNTAKARKAKPSVSKDAPSFFVKMRDYVIETDSSLGGKRFLQFLGKARKR